MISLLSALYYLNITKGKLTGLIELTFNREALLYLACNEKHTFTFLNNQNIWFVVMSEGLYIFL